MIRLLKIARREYLSYLRTPGFWISLCVAPLVLGFALLGGPKVLESAAPPPRLAIVDLTRSGFERALRPVLG
ncbi:MAG: ABC transporter permease, partial [Caulobacteraceae bacterium]